MTDNVTAADLAAALRNVRPYLEYAGAHLAYFALDQNPLSDLSKYIDSLLDRYDAQLREALKRSINESIQQRNEHMDTARDLKPYKHARDLMGRSVEEARAANHRILALRHQLRELERTSNGTQ